MRYSVIKNVQMICVKYWLHLVITNCCRPHQSLEVLTVFCVWLQVRQYVVQVVFSITFAFSCTMFELIIFEILGALSSR